MITKLKNYFQKDCNIETIELGISLFESEKHKMKNEEIDIILNEVLKKLIYNNINVKDFYFKHETIRQRVLIIN